MFVTNDIEILVQSYSIKKRIDLLYINRITIYSKMYNIIKSPNITTMTMPPTLLRSSSLRARRSSAISLMARG